ncbi:MAG: hypothetical protein KAT41_01730, partial [Candidatus Marinimicrobia bacterium]|nr:hypothetical protein [Candidatus Neomarinimicrobiota bacterium]
MLSICMWDLDSSSADAYTEHVSDYAPNWWGTQWVATDFERYYLYRGVVLKDEPVEIPTNAHSDPPYIQVVSVEEPLVIDGILDETDWLRRFDYLVYNVGYITGDIEYAVTGDVLLTGTYTDTTTTLVKFLHDGLDLYISLTSDDHYVGVNGTSWEGDGLFMKIKDASGTAYEYKLFFNHTGTDPDIHYEEGIVGSGEGAAWKHPATIVNDDAAPDSGYTAEMVIHLDQLGYTDPYSEIPVMINIFDPDENGTSYHKMWWGSEWGSEFRILRLADPPLRTAYNTEDDIVLDGKLDESLWNGAEFAVVGKGSALSTGGYYMQWGDILNEYTDQSMATVKFMHKGTDLYI